MRLCGTCWEPLKTAGQPCDEHLVAILMRFTRRRIWRPLLASIPASILPPSAGPHQPPLALAPTLALTRTPTLALTPTPTLALALAPTLTLTFALTLTLTLTR